MLKNDNWILITDKIRDFSLLEKEIPLKNRIIVEVFNRFDYAVCLWKGFTPAYSLPWDSKNLKDLNNFTAEWYTVSGIAWDRKQINLMHYIKNLRRQKKEVLLYTAGKPNHINMESDIFIKENIKIYFFKNIYRYRTIIQSDIIRYSLCVNPAGRSSQPPQQVCPPNRSQKKLGGELGGTAHVLGFFGQGVPLQRNAVHHVLDGTVKQLHQQAKYQRHGQQNGFRPIPSQPAGQGQANHGQQAYLPESLLVLPGGFVAGQGIPRGIQQANQSPLSFQFVASIHTHSHSQRC